MEESPLEDTSVTDEPLNEPTNQPMYDGIIAGDERPIFPCRPRGTRPKGVHVKHLTELERYRIRVLYFDAKFTYPRIKQVTGYSISQIRTAVHAQTAAVAPRPGRPKRGTDNNTPSKKPADDSNNRNNAGASSQSVPEPSPSVASGDGHVNHTPTPAPTAEPSHLRPDGPSHPAISAVTSLLAFTNSSVAPSPSAPPPGALPASSS
ncbi:hypothetical protein F5Y02DRAFT_420628 [Annulohypoxylon stygium]|nr:hypothetical protein F5Y02DRAFT_420628 [Annulohypoxylon stygium]